MQSIKFYLLPILFLTLSFIPINVADYGVFSFVFIPVLLCLLMIMGVQFFDFSGKLSPLVFVQVCFFCFLIVSFLLGLFVYDSKDVVLSVVSFMPFMFSPIMYKYFMYVQQYLKKYRFILVSILVFSSFYTFKFMFAIVNHLPAIGRLTWLDFDAVIPLNFFGCILLFSMICVGKQRHFLIWILYFLHLVTLVFTITKSIYLCLFICHIYIGLKNKKWLSKIVFLSVCVCVSLNFFSGLKNTGYFSDVNVLIGSRFLKSKSDIKSGRRLQEYKQGINAFKEAPIVGKFLGYKLMVKRGAYWEMKRYIHNGSVYILMNLGLVGFILFYAPFMVLLNFRKVKNISRTDNVLKVYFESALLFILVFTQFFATLRIIHFNMLLVFHLNSYIAFCDFNKRRK
jgi:hypothetical protein